MNFNWIKTSLNTFGGSEGWRKKATRHWATKTNMTLTRTSFFLSIGHDCIWASVIMFSGVALLLTRQRPLLLRLFSFLGTATASPFGWFHFFSTYGMVSGLKKHISEHETSYARQRPVRRLPPAGPLAVVRSTQPVPWLPTPSNKLRDRPWSPI